MMRPESLRLGMPVRFGRPNGEKTLGEIIKINPGSAKVRTLEDRGRGSGKPSGIVWRVPFSMLYPVEGQGEPRDHLATAKPPSMADVFPHTGNVRRPQAVSPDSVFFKPGTDGAELGDDDELPNDCPINSEPALAGWARTVLRHEGQALALCKDLVRRAAMFICERVEGGWLFMVKE